MKQLILLIIIILIPATSISADYFQPVPILEVLRVKDRSDVVLFDVNPQDVWEKHHIHGAVHITGDDLFLKSLPKDKKTTLIFYCAGPLCRESADFANRAIIYGGYRNVYVMTDGIFTWVKAGYPVESGIQNSYKKK